MSPVKSLIFRVSRSVGLFTLTRKLRSRQLLILCYHGFQMQDEASFRPTLFINRDTFVRRMGLLKSMGFRVIPLEQALDELYSNTLKPKTVAITIDDGFYSVHDVAYPVLKANRFPAMLYVTSYYAEKQTPVFRLAVQYLFWKSSRKSIDMRSLPWLEADSVNLKDAGAVDKVMWECIEHGETQCSNAQREALLGELGAIVGVSYEEVARKRLLSLVNDSEMRELAQNGVDIQLHTHRHRLPADDEAAAREEIRANRHVLERSTDKALEHFCYPSGLWHSGQWEWLEKEGVKSATTTLPGYNYSSTNPLGLRRFLDGEHVSELEFIAEVNGFSDVVRKAAGILSGGRIGHKHTLAVLTE